MLGRFISAGTNGKAMRILRTVGKRCEISLQEAIDLGRSRTSPGSHLEQYPLAFLIEEGYVGCTLNHCPPKGAELMREFSQAMSLHLFTVPPDSSGVRCYGDISSSGSVTTENERVFIKAKGALYLDEKWEKWVERLSSGVVGVAVGLITGVLLNYLGALK